MDEDQRRADDGGDRGALSAKPGEQDRKQGRVGSGGDQSRPQDGPRVTVRVLKRLERKAA